MSIATEIERIKNAKTSIKTAIENKGVEVGNGTIDTYASKINAISVANFKITSLYNLFYQGNRLNVYNELMALVDDVTTINGAFTRCSNLESIDLSDKNLSECTDFTNAFNYCTKLTNLVLPKQNIAKVVNFSNTFAQCSALKNLDLSMIDAEKVENVNGMFTGCSALTNFKSIKNLGKGFTAKSKNYYGYQFNFNTCNNLTKNSLLDIIYNLYDLNLTYPDTLYTQSLVLGSTNKAKLTAEEIAIATNKGWTVS